MRIATLIAVTLMLCTLPRSGPAGLEFSVDTQRISFTLRSAAVNLAFDIGQSRPESDSRRKAFS